MTIVASCLSSSATILSGTITDCIPAKQAARTPFGASSKTRHCKKKKKKIVSVVDGELKRVESYISWIRFVGEALSGDQKYVRGWFANFNIGIGAAHDFVMEQIENGRMVGHLDFGYFLAGTRGQCKRHIRVM